MIACPYVSRGCFILAICRSTTTLLSKAISTCKRLCLGDCVWRLWCLLSANSSFARILPPRFIKLSTIQDNTKSAIPCFFLMTTTICWPCQGGIKSAGQKYLWLITVIWDWSKGSTLYLFWQPHKSELFSSATTLIGLVDIKDNHLNQICSIVGQHKSGFKLLPFWVYWHFLDLYHSLLLRLYIHT